MIKKFALVSLVGLMAVACGGGVPEAETPEAAGAPETPSTDDATGAADDAAGEATDDAAGGEDAAGGDDAAGGGDAAGGDDTAE